jgi:hypothetical protein
MSKHASTAAAIQCSSASSKSHSDKESRYFQLMLLVLAAGAIYPILYLRQVYQTTMLEVFHINHSELGYLYSMLGTIFLLSYLPSGWLAGRPYRTALSDFLLAGRHRRPGPVVLHRAVDDRSDDHLRLLGPDHRPDLLGLGAQRVKMIAHHSEQGRFFGILDGGRGLVEALLATVARDCSPLPPKPVASRQPKASIHCRTRSRKTTRRASSRAVFRLPVVLQPLPADQPRAHRDRLEKPEDAALIDPNYLSTQKDIDEVIQGSRLMRKIMQAPALRGITVEQTDEQMLQYFCDNSGSIYHLCGSCAMGADTQKSVVDKRLKVHGLEGCGSSMRRFSPT